MVTAYGVEAGPTLPAGSVTVAVRLCAPSSSGLAGVKLHLPSVPTVVLPSTSVPSRTVTTLPASALPLNTGVVSLVRPPVSTGIAVPLLLLLSCRSVAAAGGVVSTVKVTGVDAPLLLPAASVTVVVRLCAPSPSAIVGVKLQLPSVSAVAVPSTVVPSSTVMVLPASALPRNTGVLSLVIPPAAIAVPPSLLSCRPVEVAGGCVSTVKLIGSDGSLTLPDALVTVVVRLCAPSLNAGVLKLQLPPLPTTTVPSTVVPSSTVTVLPAAALPLSTGVVSLVAPPDVIGTGVPPLSLFSSRSAATGGWAVSILTTMGADAGPTLPAGSVTVAVSVCSPAVNGAVGITLQLPSLPTAALPITVVPSLTVTMLPASAMPLSAGVVSLVVPPAAIGTGVAPSLLLSCRPVAAAGGVISTVTTMGAEGAPVLPAGLVTVAVRL